MRKDPPELMSASEAGYGLPRGNLQKCRSEARGGGWLLNFSSSLGPECPLANIQAFFEEATGK